MFEVVEIPGGLCVGARRNAENGNYYWRITQWVMPTFTMIPPRGNHAVHGHVWIPVDDENCWAWSFDYHPTRPLTDTELSAVRDGKGIHVKYVPGTYRPLANKDNDYLIDRRALKANIRRPTKATAASKESPCRIPHCRKAWDRLSIAPKSTWFPPTAASSSRVKDCCKP